MKTSTYLQDAGLQAQTCAIARSTMHTLNNCSLHSSCSQKKLTYLRQPLTTLRPPPVSPVFVPTPNLLATITCIGPDVPPCNTALPRYQETSQGTQDMLAWQGTNELISLPEKRSFWLPSSVIQTRLTSQRQRPSTPFSAAPTQFKTAP